jgi:hypothetical protein
VVQEPSFQLDKTSTDIIEPPKVIKSNRKVSPIPSTQNRLNVPNESNQDMISQNSGFSGLSKQLQTFGKGFGGIQNLVGLSALGTKKLRLSPSKLGAPQNSAQRLTEGFKSTLEIVPVFTEKLDLGERTFLNVEQMQNLKLDFDQIW